MEVATVPRGAGGRWIALEARLTDALSGLWLTGAAFLVSYGALAQGAFFWDQASLFAACAAALGFAASSRERCRDRLGLLGLGLIAAGPAIGVVVNGWTPDA